MEPTIATAVELLTIKFINKRWLHAGADYSGPCYSFKILRIENHGGSDYVVFENRKLGGAVCSGINKNGYEIDYVVGEISYEDLQQLTSQRR